MGYAEPYRRAFTDHHSYEIPQMGVPVRSLTLHLW
jgi:hypothetical protein